MADYTSSVYPIQQGTIINQRSPKNIVDELEFWKRVLKAEVFIFRDPVFSINKKHTIEKQKTHK